VIGARHVSPGERVSPGGESGPDGSKEASGLARIDSLDEMELIFTIPEVVIASIGKGRSVEVRVAPFPEETFAGVIYFVDPRVNEISRRVLVKARIPNPGHKLRPGLFAHVDMEVEHRAAALMVPEDAVVYGRDGTFVWRIVDGQAASVPVELGIRQPGRVELRSGVREGDRIVAAGTHKVRPGMVLRDVTAGNRSSNTAETGGT
jgi:membrane fusion protein (multidrug efflux system)